MAGNVHFCLLSPVWEGHATAGKIFGQAHEQRSKRNDFLLKAGQPENHINCVLSGAIRALLVTDLEGHTIRFAYPGNLITSLSAFFQQAPSTIYLQALSGTVVQMVPRDAFYAYLQLEPQRLGHSHALGKPGL